MEEIMNIFIRRSRDPQKKSRRPPGWKPLHYTNTCLSSGGGILPESRLRWKHHARRMCWSPHTNGLEQDLWLREYFSRSGWRGGCRPRRPWSSQNISFI